MVIMLFLNRGAARMGHSQAEKAENRERILPGFAARWFAMGWNR